ncbi:barstar family protein [Micromonospora halophytica]|uniref:barstar family protein n=1 Tax=Micromonospora halophytica TaxID=47864 RepID=UPI003CCBCA67
MDGQHVTDRTGLLLALGKALLGPGANYGKNLDSVEDYLCGGLSPRAPRSPSCSTTLPSLATPSPDTSGTTSAVCPTSR